MPTPPDVTDADRARKRKILDALRNRSFDHAAADPAVRPLLDEEAHANIAQKLVTPDALKIADVARPARDGGPAFGLFSSADVIIVPGFLGSELTDETGGNGLIWVDPSMVVTGTDQLMALRLKEAIDDDAVHGVTVRPRGAIPLVYSGLKAALEFSGYDVRIFGFDWRKHVDASAAPLADAIRVRAGRRPRPLHVVAHSQGTLVARRALQMVGPDLSRRLVNSLVLLGPATAGTFSAAFALAGTHSMIDTARRYGLAPPPAFDAVLQSMSGLYQLLPWREHALPGTGDNDPALKWVRDNMPSDRPIGFRDPATWQRGIDAGRLTMHGWGRSIDAGFLNDRTTVILGDAPTTGGVKYNATGQLVEDEAFAVVGDGTVPESMARVDGVTRVFKAAGAEHMMLPATWSVIMAVRDVLADRHPRIDQAFAAATPTGTRPSQAAPRFLEAGALPSPAQFFGAAAEKAVAGKPTRTPAGSPAAPDSPAPPHMADVSPPAVRRLRVFSFDPLFAADLDNVGAEQVTVELPWEFADGDHLQPGPVGEYLEVVDFDASSRCFYPPVDLNHPHLLAQDGVPVSEGDPRFHQQMVYAVMMNTIRQFEAALGRVALWAPNLPRNPVTGEVEFPKDHRPGDEYVGRLRVYPHAMRARNAFYSPAKKALLLGYFPAEGPDVGRNLPGGMIFSALSYDIIAHETTHALLDGMHRYFTQPSNPDVFAFHEAFADVVALLQHFSHPEVLRHEIARARGDLGRESVLGVLAAQFGEASGQRSALREYLGRVAKNPDQTVKKDDLGRPVWEPVLPDPAVIRKIAEPHARGAILVAAIFRAFRNIYDARVQDLRRIASGGTGILPDGDLHPDMVNRMADEAAKAARHLLRMCVRALDYVPPVDVTFGEYLRALITADYDLVRNDDRRYRVAVVAAFRDWGIYPEGVRSLSVDSLLWAPPEWRTDPHTKKPRAGTGGPLAMAGLKKFFADNPIENWPHRSDRRAIYRRTQALCAAFHEWLADPDNLPPDLSGELGLRLDPADVPRGIPRAINRAVGRVGGPKPRFNVHSFRLCRRIGPDGQELTDAVVEVLQRRLAYFDEARQREIDDPKKPPMTDAEFAAAEPDFYFRGGCTLILDPESGAVRYCIRKSIGDNARLARERACRQGRGLTGNFLAPPDGDNPFAILHTDE
ncbi:hypothetical protein J0H58_08565 [bacterium]|nr:hypothetical protein [bacterium]